MKNDSVDQQIKERRKSLFYQNGKFYFTQKTERRFFFIMTLIMLLLGLLVKLGWN